MSEPDETEALQRDLGRMDEVSQELKVVDGWSEYVRNGRCLLWLVTWSESACRWVVTPS